MKLKNYLQIFEKSGQLKERVVTTILAETVTVIVTVFVQRTRIWMEIQTLALVSTLDSNEIS